MMIKKTILLLVSFFVFFGCSYPGDEESAKLVLHIIGAPEDRGSIVVTEYLVVRADILLENPVGMTASAVWEYGDGEDYFYFTSDVEGEHTLTITETDEADHVSVYQTAYNVELGEEYTLDYTLGGSMIIEVDE